MEPKNNVTEVIKHVTFFHTNDIAFLHTDNDQRENQWRKKILVSIITKNNETGRNPTKDM